MRSIDSGASPVSEFQLMLRRCLLAAFATLIVGGASARDAPVDYVIDDASDRGLMIVSMTIPLAESLGGRSPRQSYLYAKKGSIFGKELSLVERVLLEKDPSNDFDGVFGQLKVIELPAGDYEFFNWSLNNMFKPREAERLPFTIVAGRATYVGNLDLKVRVGRNAFGMKIVVDPRIFVVDQRERDLAVFRARYTAVPADRIDIGLLPIGPWRMESADLEIPPPLVTPSQ